MAIDPAQATPPTAAIRMAIAGIVPLVVLAVGVLTGIANTAVPSQYALQLYSAVLLSFLGGIQWGMLARAPGANPRDLLHYAMTMLPSFAAWAGLWFAGHRGLWLLAAAFVGAFLQDRYFVTAGVAPAWHSRLRLPLTVVVVACLGAVAAFGPF